MRSSDPWRCGLKDTTSKLCKIRKLRSGAMEQSPQILLVGQDRSTRSLPWISSENGWQLETAGSAWEALELVRCTPGPDLIVLDLVQTESEGLHPLRWLRRIRPDLPVLVLGN